jgi:hypothetical protein
MSFLDTMKSWFKGKAQQLTHVTFDAGRSDKPAGAPIEAGKGYFRLWLAQMFLEHDRVLFQTQGPVVHSVVRFQFGNTKDANPTVEIPHIAGPLKLKIDKDSLKNVVQRNYNITPLMPYHGGVVEVAAGLTAVPTGSAAEQVLEVMQDFSGLLAVPQLSAVLNIAGPLVKGVQAIANMGQDGLQLGLHEGFGAEAKISSGYFVVIDAPEEEVPKDKLWIVNDTLRVGDSLGGAAPYTARSYMLFKIEGRADRDDWEFLTTLNEPFQKAMELAPTDPAQSDAALRQAILAAWRSPELVAADRPRVAKAIRERFEAFKKDMGLGAIPRGISLADTVTKVSRAQIAADPPSLKELLG